MAETNVTFTPYVRNIPYCLPLGSPLLPQTLPLVVALLCATFIRFAVYLAATGPREPAFAKLAAIGEDARRHTETVKSRGFGARIRDWGFDTFSEGLTLWVVRRILVLCAIWSQSNAFACLLIPLPVAGYLIVNVAIINVSFTNFKNAEHQIAAGIFVFAVWVLVAIICAKLVAYEPWVLASFPDLWILLLVMICAAAVSFLLYPALVWWLKRMRAPKPLTSETAMAVATYLVCAEYAFGIFVTLPPFFVTTNTFPAAVPTESSP